MNADLNPTQRRAAPPARQTLPQTPAGSANANAANANPGAELFANLLQAAEAEACQAQMGDSRQPKDPPQGEAASDAPPGKRVDPALRHALPTAHAAQQADPVLQTQACASAAPASLSAACAAPASANEGSTSAPPASAGTNNQGRARGKNGLAAGLGMPMQGGPKVDQSAHAAAANPSAKALEQAHSHAAFLRAEAVRTQAASTLLPVLAGLPVGGWLGASAASAAVASAEEEALSLTEAELDLVPDTGGRAGGAAGSGSAGGGNGGGSPGSSGYGMPAALEAGSASSASGETDSLGSEFTQQLDAALSSDGWASVFEPLGHQISLWAAGQTRKAQLLLHEGLRQTLQVELRLDDAQAHLDFYTDDAQLRETLLAQAREALSEMLGRSGLELAGLSVGARTAADAHARGQNGRDPAPQARANASPGASDAAVSGARELAQHLRPGMGRVGLSVYV